MTRKGIRISIRRFVASEWVDTVPVLWPKWFVWQTADGEWHTESENWRRLRALGIRVR